MELSPVKKIDYVLRFIKSIDTTQLYDSHTIAFILNPKGQVIIKQTEIIMAINKLLLDGYLTEKRGHTGSDYITISYDGQLFHGYEEQQRLDKIISDQNELTLSQSQKNADLIVLWTSVASVIGALLLLWQILSWFFPHYSDYPYHWFWETIPKTP